MFNIQNIHLKVPLFGRGAISEDLKSILIIVRYNTPQYFANLPCPSSNLVYRSLESTIPDQITPFFSIFPLLVPNDASISCGYVVMIPLLVQMAQRKPPTFKDNYLL